ncbi:MAG: OmpP1/FadL family transporter [Acidithiobacillales bacterium]
MLRLKCVRLLAGALLVFLLAAAPRGNGAGFALYEQGSRANAMAGAFVAQADDPSAMFFNPAGLAFNEKFTLYGGAFLIFRPTSHFDGANPYPGEDYSANMKKAMYWIGHGYGVIPIKPGSINVGVGFWSPFGLGVPWENPDSYAGRFISQRVDIRQVALSAEIAVKLADWISIGAGPEMRLTDVKLSRNVGIFNPFNDRFTDVAHLSLISEGTPVRWTWNAGILLKPCERLRLGASYHGKVNVDLSGTAEFYQIPTGYPQLDAAAAARIPMNQPLPGSTTIQFPDVLMFGVSYDLSPKLTLEVDGNHTGWDVFDQTTIDIQGVPSSTIPHGFENTWTVRAGLGWQVSEPVWLGGGFLYDQTPQPDYDVGAILPDNNRTGVTIGAGFQLSKMFRVDISSLFLWFHERTTNTNEAGFNGTYKTFAILPGLSFKGTF